MKRWVLCSVALAVGFLALLLVGAEVQPAQAAILAPSITFTPPPSPTPAIASGVFGIRRQVPVTLTVPLSAEPGDAITVPLGFDVRLSVGFKTARGVTVTVAGAPTPGPSLSMTEVLSYTLLTASDLPEGWELYFAGADNLFATDSNSANFLCGYGLPTNVAPLVQQTSFVIFTPDNARFLTQVSSSMARGDAAGVVAALTERLPRCRRWTETNNSGVEVTWRVSRYSAPPVGDESISFGTLADELEVRYVFFRVGDVLVMMQQAHSGTPIDDDLLAETAAVAAERLQQALEVR